MEHEFITVGNIDLTKYCISITKCLQLEIVTVVKLIQLTAAQFTWSLWSLSKHNVEKVKSNKVHVILSIIYMCYKWYSLTVGLISIIGITQDKAKWTNTQSWQAAVSNNKTRSSGASRVDVHYLKICIGSNSIQRFNF